MKTETLVHFESLGPAAAPHDLVPFYDALAAAADRDPRVQSYGATEVRGESGEVVAYRITLEGFVSAEEYADEVYEGKHGAW